MMGLAISVTTRCAECVRYHLDGCRREGASREGIAEAVKTGVLARGSSPFPDPRSAFAALDARGRSMCPSES